MGVFRNPKTRPLAIAAVRKAAPYVVRGARGAYRTVQRMRGKQASIEPNAITTQHDTAVRYRRRRMPRRRRKQWTRFSKKVKHVMLQMQGLQTYVIDNPGAVQPVAVDTQVTDGWMLGGTQSVGNDELFQIFRAAFSAALTTTTVAPYKLFLKSMCLDIQIRNTHATVPCIIDVYTLIARQDYSSAANIKTQYDATFVQQGPMFIGAVTPGNPGVTPFQNGPFLKMWKILSKKEYFLSSGGMATMQLRIPFNRMISGRTIMSQQSQIRGLTRAFLFQARGPPTNNAGSAQLNATEFTWKGQCTVVFGVPPGQVLDETAEL